MATFGNTNEEVGIDSVYSRGDPYGVGNVCGSIFTVGEDGDASSITVGLSAMSVMAEYNVKCAIYDSDENFVAETEERTGLTFGASLKWETFTFASSVHFVAGDYYLMVFAECTRYPQYSDLYIWLTMANAIDWKQYTKEENNYPIFPPSIPPVFLYNRASIYCTYIPAVVEYTLTISVSGEGTTDPAPGEHTYEEDTEVPVTHYPSGGWRLDYWTLDDVNVGTDNPYTVTMDADHVLVAVFIEIPPAPKVSARGWVQWAKRRKKILIRGKEEEIFELINLMEVLEKC